MLTPVRLPGFSTSGHRATPRFVVLSSCSRPGRSTSADFSPIEPCWSKIKTLLRAKEARSVEALDGELPAVLSAISARDARGWFRCCGYRAPN